MNQGHSCPARVAVQWAGRTRLVTLGTDRDPTETRLRSWHLREMHGTGTSRHSTSEQARLWPGSGISRRVGITVGVIDRPCGHINDYRLREGRGTFLAGRRVIFHSFCERSLFL
jgi:hypothetical protein